MISRTERESIEMDEYIHKIVKAAEEVVRRHNRRPCESEGKDCSICELAKALDNA